MVSLSLCAIGSLVAFGFLATTGVWARTSVRAVYDATTMALALDIVERDVLSASNKPKDWLLDRGIFKICTVSAQGNVSEAWVGWDIVKQGLRRRYGIYDGVRWVHATTSIVGCRIHSLAFEPQMNAEQTVIESVTCACKQPRSVSLFTRSIV